MCLLMFSNNLGSWITGKAACVLRDDSLKEQGKLVLVFLAAGYSGAACCRARFTSTRTNSLPSCV